MNKSRYDVIWNELKLDRSKKKPLGVQVAAPPSIHKRIIKAVIKRKNIDLSYKFIQSDSGRKIPRLDYTVAGNVITFRLFYDKMLESLG